jgi:hypothetical protein
MTERRPEPGEENYTLSRNASGELEIRPGEDERWAGNGYSEDKEPHHLQTGGNLTGPDLPRVRPEDAGWVAKLVSGEDEWLMQLDDATPDKINVSGDDMAQSARDAAFRYLQDIGLDPTPDAVQQLDLVFRRCLTIMCERPWDPEGGTWREAGRLGALADVRKKFQRLWYRAWICGKSHDDSAIDLINYTGFYLRSENNRWNEWGEPGRSE